MRVRPRSEQPSTRHSRRSGARNMPGVCLLGSLGPWYSGCRRGRLDRGERSWLCLSEVGALWVGMLVDVPGVASETFAGVKTILWGSMGVFQVQSLGGLDGGHVAIVVETSHMSHLASFTTR
jgi:hypothetical protein